jgi:uncharacterized 2Fe-2S/4Fe-4S cluster protein (DUF4445 family)
MTNTKDNSSGPVKYRVLVEPAGAEVYLEPDRPLTSALRRAGAKLEELCGGRGACGGCKVRVSEGRVTAPSKAELCHLTSDELDQGLRLACQVRVLGDLKVSVLPSAVAGAQRVLTAASHGALIVDPPVRAYDVQPPQPSVDDQRADDRRVLEELRARHGVECTAVDLECLRELSSFMRDRHWHVRALVRDRELIGVKSVDVPVLGMAVDLGTTGLAASLYDMSDGKVLAARGVPNPQHSYGEDVITRIDAARRSAAHAEELRRVAVQALDRMADELTSTVGASSEDIAELVVVGNTAMHHLFLGLPVGQLARAPYLPAVSLTVELKAREVGLNLMSGAYVFLPPNPAAFIGSDHIAMLLAVGADELEGPSLFIDIGTNTEICLTTGDGMTSVSCASGPAFEGFHLSSGMRAAPGAIERLALTDQEVKFETIDGRAPIGLCGSGLVDLCSEMLRVGLIDASGRMVKDHKRLTTRGAEAAFTVLDRGEHNAENPIAITQRDIRNVQLAKAAIQAGTDILLRSAGIGADNLSQVIVAGAFGNYLNVHTAQNLGLLPAVPPEKVVQIGNAAGTGAGMMLLSLSCRERAAGIARKLRYRELAAQPDFQQIFLNSIALGHRPGRKRSRS